MTGLAIWSAASHQRFIHASRGAYHSTPVPLGAAAVVLGIGLGSFIDGIVFHQILQWHGMVSNKLPLTTLENKSINMFWDGIFHLFTFVTIVTGITMLWRLQDRKDAIRSTDLLIGGLCLGWGFFNIVEGVIDHHILKLHNVREIADSVELWNSWFLGASFCLFAAGLFVCTAARRKIFIKA